MPASVGGSFRARVGHQSGVWRTLARDLAGHQIVRRTARIVTEPRRIRDLTGCQLARPQAAGFGKDRVDAALDVRWNGFRSVDGAQTAEPRLEIRFDRLGRLAVARDGPGDEVVIRREVGGAVPRHQGDPILREQALTHERRQGVHASHHRLVPPAPQHHQEDALVGGGDFRAGRAAQRQFRRRGPPDRPPAPASRNAGCPGERRLREG